ncbi:MAG TPA: hypothetical protein VM802_18600 [Chitinophaga sp.]|uniref:hypothetical protein n=1 Tax=Chitinophaga sp. TaxID=1869181 RepID=UPI002CA12C28|nr:hypothetical protein [Chitinophaga sp.]HVI46896.1 hypothetical protein [Chitinophaga sp.]
MKSYFSTNRVLAWTFTSVALATLFFACKKEVTTDNASNNETDNHTMDVAVHETKANAIYNDLFDVAASAVNDQGVGGRKATNGNTQRDPVSCPSTLISSVDPNIWPKTITVEYGDACLDKYGITRSGKVYIKLSGLLLNKGSMEITLENYRYNGIPVAGTTTITDVASLATGIQYTSTVSNGRISLGDTLILGYSSKKTVKQIEGAATPVNPADDVFSIDGNASLTYEKGGPAGAGMIATISTVTPLVKAWSCQWVSQGQLKIDFNKVTGVIDYGKGGCDSNATITVNGKAKEITLK